MAVGADDPASTAPFQCYSGLWCCTACCCRIRSRSDSSCRIRRYAGEPVPIVLRLTNKTERTLTLALQGRPIAFDVVIAREDGALVWRRLEGEVVTAILAVRTLAPAESLVFEARWNGRDRSGAVASPGRYTVTGILPTDQPAGLSTRATPLTLRRTS